MTATSIRGWVADKGNMSFWVGILCGLIPSMKGYPTISLLILALWYTYKHRDDFSFYVSIPIFQYLIVQFSLTWWHAGVPFPLDIQNYYVLLILTIPFIHFFLAHHSFSVDEIKSGLVVGLIVSALLLGVDYYSPWNGSTCRAMALQINPLRAAIFYVPIAGALIALDARNQRFGLVAALLVVLMLVYSGALTGARMTFYSSIVVIAMLGAYFLFTRQIKNVAKLAGAAFLGLVAVIFIDVTANCNFAHRIVGNFSNAADILERRLGSAEEATAAPAPSNENAPAAEPPAQNSTTNTSEGARARLWAKAIESIVDHPLLGTGNAAEEDTIGIDEVWPGLTGFSHNQYLSWALWGGIVSLLSGFLLLATHFLCCRNPFAAAVFVTSFAISSITMSSLAIGGAMAEFVLILLLLSPILGQKQTRWIRVISR